MTKSKILIQLDSDSQVNTFDSVVAIDSGVEHLFRHANVSASNVTGLIHGAMFTRGSEDLKSTAIFIGGSDTEVADAILAKVKQTFFGPVRVSVLADPNGANTTAAAAVLSAQQHLELNGKTIAILAGTGPVGQRIAQIIARTSRMNAISVKIRLASRSLEKAKKVCSRMQPLTETAEFEAVAANNAQANLELIAGADLVFAAGAAGVELLPFDWLKLKHPPKVAIDLNAVPPSGMAGIDAIDNGTLRMQTICYGALGVGRLKMKIHRRAIENLFQSNELVLEVEEVYEIGKHLLQSV